MAKQDMGGQAEPVAYCRHKDDKHAEFSITKFLLNIHGLLRKIGYQMDHLMLIIPSFILKPCRPVQRHVVKPMDECCFPVGQHVPFPCPSASSIGWHNYRQNSGGHGSWQTHWCTGHCIPESVYHYHRLCPRPFSDTSQASLYSCYAIVLY